MGNLLFLNFNKGGGFESLKIDKRAVAQNFHSKRVHSWINGVISFQKI